MHLPIAPAQARAMLVVDLIGDLDAVLAQNAGEILASYDAERTNAVDVTLDLTHVARYVPEGIRDLGCAIAERRLTGRATTVRVENGRLRSKLRAAGVSCEQATSLAPAPDRHVMIARHAPSRG